MAEDERQQSYAAVLGDIERRIADLQMMATNLRSLMGLPAVESQGKHDGQDISTLPPLVGGQGSGPSDPLSLVKVGDFFGKSYAEAAREFLRRAKEPQTTITILHALRKAHYELKAKNPASTLYTTLSRHHGFRLVTRNTWGLADWYPGSEKKRVEPKQQKKPQRKARPVKAKTVEGSDDLI